MAERTIFALASGAGKAGIAVVRLSGPETLRAIKTLAGRESFVPRRAHLCDIGGVDSGLILWFPAPASFTGEDAAELHVHGGRAILRELSEALAGLGLEPAHPGEFTRRAVTSGKMSVMQAEALLDLVNAETKAQKDLARRHLGAPELARYDGWRARLTREIALAEARIDFAEDAATQLDAAPDDSELFALAYEIDAHLERMRRSRPLRDGFRVAIAGPVNVGKSSLINALSRSDAAIVSDQAGTTRDVVSVAMEIAGLPVTVSDTAGLRETSDRLERIGIGRAMQAVADADLTLCLSDGSESVADAVLSSEIRRLTVRNKIDANPVLPCEPAYDALISCADGTGIDALTERIAAEIADSLSPAEDAAFAGSRHRERLDRASRHISDALESHDELRSEALRLALGELDALTGADGSDAVLNEVFRNFCIGK